jgi:transposase
MPRACSTDLRERALTACEAGEGSQAQVAERYRIGERTLSGWLKVAREEGRREPRSRAGAAGRRSAAQAGRWPGWSRSGTTRPWTSAPTGWPSAPASGAAARPCAGR